jgi:two-component system phosphate regulon sensor histidine kinase PhoR
VARELVLIIDGSHETQHLLAELVLKPGDYRSLAALDGEGGIRLALQEHPDLIVLGMELPQMNGLEVLQVLRRRNVDIPVIFTTARESAELVVQAFRLGAHDFVIKPFGPQEMQEVIQRILTATTLREERDQLAHQLAEARQQLQLFETVEAERARLEAVLWGAQEAVVVVDEENAILLCNAASRAALDLGDADLLHQPVGETIPHPALLSMFSQARETGRETRSEVPLDDGRTFNAQLTPIAGVGRVLVMQDITHLKELDRVKSEFVTAVSHDLRTPLTTIQGYIELLPRAGALTAQQHEFIQHVLQSLETITELVDNLLDSDRLEAGFDLEMGPCDLLQVIEQTIRDFRPRVEKKKQELRWDPPEALPLVQGNRHRLRQVMDNLLNNAMKYTQEGGWIAVNALEDNGHVVVHVADNGIGILPAQQPYIFDKFYRVESEETLRITGTGLGLSIVKTVIEKHNGRVWVESKAGEGSVFSFVLPALKT